MKITYYNKNYHNSERIERMIFIIMLLELLKKLI